MNSKKTKHPSSTKHFPSHAHTHVSFPTLLSLLDRGHQHLTSLPLGGLGGEGLAEGVPAEGGSVKKQEQ